MGAPGFPTGLGKVVEQPGRVGWATDGGWLPVPGGAWGLNFLGKILEHLEVTGGLLLC